jgi:hypothetical protein
MSVRIAGGVDRLIWEMKLYGLEQPLDETLIARLPNPIAQACAAFNQAREAVQRFVAFDRLLTYLIKYLAAIFIGQVRRDTPPEFPLPDRLAWVARPMLENWTNTITELSQIYQQPTMAGEMATAGRIGGLPPSRSG